MLGTCGKRECLGINAVADDLDKKELDSVHIKRK